MKDTEQSRSGSQTRLVEPDFAGSADVVVIGGGIRGVSIAYYLAKAGMDVVVVERRAPLAGASSANAGWVNISGKDPAFYTQFSLESQRLYCDLEAELDADLDYECHGGLSVAETEKELETKAQYAAQQNRVPGLQIDILNAAEARRLEPALSPSSAGATYCARDAVVDPWKVGIAFSQAARRLGCRMLTRTTVRGIELRGGGVAAVMTDRGTIGTRIVVNAAGIQAAAIGRMVGVEVPVVALRGQILVTEAIAPLLQRPVGELHQSRKGNVLIGITHDLDLERYDRRVEYEAMVRLVGRATRIVPALRSVHIIRAFAGLRPWPIDGLPIMGSCPGWPDGFVCATGHSGVTLGPITGKVISELITTGKTSWPIDEYTPARFGRTLLAFPTAMYRKYATRAISPEEIAQKDHR